MHQGCQSESEAESRQSEGFGLFSYYPKSEFFGLIQSN